MQEIIKKLFSDKIAGYSITLSSVLLFISLVSIIVTYHLLPPYIPLYNKMSWGYLRLGSTFEIFFPLLLVGFFIAANCYIGISMQQKIPLLSRFLFITSVSLSIFTTIFIIKLLTVII